MRLALIDSQAMVRESLSRALVAALPGARLVFCGMSVRDAASACVPARCDCVILDPSAAGEGREVRAVAEVSAWGVPVVVIGSAPASHEAALERACLTAGAAAYVSKRQDVRRLVIAIRAATGQRDAARTGRSAGERAPAQTVGAAGGIALSSQEQRALVLYASGLTLPQVALRMQLAPSTVKQYLDRVRDKGTIAGRMARTKTDLYRLARVQGLIP